VNSLWSHFFLELCSYYTAAGIGCDDFQKAVSLITFNIRNRKIMEIGINMPFKVYFLFFKSCLSVMQYIPVIVIGN